MRLTTPSTLSQCEDILEVLRTGQPLTPMDALARFRCFRLAARIYDLRRDGHNIARTWGTNGEKRWAVYRLLKEAGPSAW